MSLGIVRGGGVAAASPKRPAGFVAPVIVLPANVKTKG